MWRKAQQQDLDWIKEFLRRHLQSSMFLLGNLERYGLGSAAPRGMTIWMLDSDVSGIIGVTNDGMVLLQAPAARPENWSAIGAVLRDVKLQGCSGEAGQVQGFLTHSGLADRPFSSKDTQPLFQLRLKDLRLPDCGSHALEVLSEVHREVVQPWREAYLQEVSGLAVTSPKETAAHDISNYIARETHRVLISDGQPVAMTGFNAESSDVVQVGAVFTPPELRGKGLARQAVALHLAQARDAGKAHAVLFAASEPATKAYRAIGFQQCGEFGMAFFDNSEDAVA